MVQFNLPPQLAVTLQPKVHSSEVSVSFYISIEPVWKIFIHYAGRPPMLTAEFSALLHRVCAGLHGTQHTKNCANFFVCLRKNILWSLFSYFKKFADPFCNFKTFIDLFLINFTNFLFTFFLIWPFSWPFWARFTTSLVWWDSLVCWKFHEPEALSSAQVILCQMHPEILHAITLPCRTYSA